MQCSKLTNEVVSANETCRNLEIFSILKITIKLFLRRNFDKT